MREHDHSEPGQRTELERIARRAMVERGFLPDFSAEVHRELARRGGRPAPVPDGARDLRRLPWVSIDNEDSRDLDQLTVAERHERDVVRVLVAVADVASTVDVGSAIDAHALHNTTTVYTVPRVFPMLPLELSTDRTSLNPDVDRAALVMDFRVDPDGALDDERVYVARVQNHAQLAYPSVGAWLEGVAPAPAPVAATAELADQLRMQDEAARRLEERRRQEGALEFDTRTPSAVYADGRVTSIVERRHDRATRLIENLMIAANGVMARFLAARGAVIQRVVRRPRDWPRLREVALEHGGSLPRRPDGVALSRFLADRRRADPRGFRDLSLVVIKLLGRGEYVVGGSQGHFGLAVRDYSHSTAPNRRFPDLLTQRLALCALSGAPPPYGDEELRSIASRCTEKEADAEKIERHLRKSAAALFLRERIGERFDAVVTGASERGTWVRISQPPVEGMLVRGGEDLRVGHRLRVELRRTDVARGHLDFEVIRP